MKRVKFIIHILAFLFASIVVSHDQMGFAGDEKTSQSIQWEDLSSRLQDLSNERWHMKGTRSAAAKLGHEIQQEGFVFRGMSLDEASLRDILIHGIDSKKSFLGGQIFTSKNAVEAIPYSWGPKPLSVVFVINPKNMKVMTKGSEVILFQSVPFSALKRVLIVNPALNFEEIDMQSVPNGWCQRVLKSLLQKFR